MSRALAIAKATLLETLRSRATPPIALLMLAAAPVLSALLGDDAGARAWLSRAVPAEAFRLLLPLGVIVGGAFLLRPAFRAGWSTLPARRAEWFIGSAFAGVQLIFCAVALFAAGGVIAGVMFGTPLTRTANAAGVHGERIHEGNLQRAEFASGIAWANPDSDSWIVVELPAGLARVAGTLDFLPVLTGESAPASGAPVSLWLETQSDRVPLEAIPESRRRVSFRADVADAERMIVRAADPALLIGTSASRLRFETGTQSPINAIGALALMAFGACVLCLCAVLAIRALATAPTAALAGMLLLAALTLLPALAPAEGMARDRRRDLQAGQAEKSLRETLETDLAAVPPLFPDRYFDDFLSGYAVPPSAELDGLLRLGAGLLLLLPGAMLFTRRQIAR